MAFQEILFQFFQFFVGILIVNDGFSYDIRGGNDVQKKGFKTRKLEGESIELALIF